MAGIRMHGVGSEAIERIGYDAEERRLFVTFRGGGTYAYEGVEEDVFLRFDAAESKGGFFAAYIRGHFDFEKLKRRR